MIFLACSRVVIVPQSQGIPRTAICKQFKRSAFRLRLFADERILFALGPDIGIWSMPADDASLRI